MEDKVTKELSLEDKIKPYLIFGKGIQRDIHLIKKNQPERNVSDKKELLLSIFERLLVQVTSKDLKIPGYVFNSIEQQEHLEQLDKEIELSCLPMSKLVEISKLSSTKDIKETIEKAEKENKL